MNNKKLTLNIVISVAVIAVLAGLLIWVNSIPDKDDNTSYNNTETSEKQIEIFKVDKENVKSIKIENESETYTILKNGDEYTVPEKPNISYSSSELGFNFSAFLNISGNRDVTEDNVPFEKSAEAVVSMNDGTQHILTLGNEVVGENSRFLKYNDKIYTVPSYDIFCFNQSLNSFRDTQRGTISSELKSMSIYENGKELVSLRAATEDDNKNFQVLMSYVMTYPKYFGVSTDRLQSLFELIKEGYSLDVISFADDNISNAAKYGIGKKTVIINDGTKEYKISYGNKDENGNVYTVLNDEKSIYTMSSSLFDIIDEYNGDVLMDKLTHIADLNNVKNIVFEGMSDKYILERKGSEDNYTYDMNGTDIDESTFKAIYREIIGITSDKIAHEKVNGTPEYTVTINFSDGKTDKWEYIPYNERNYILKHNGEEKYICLKKNPTAAMTNIKNILNNN